jgi:hypothetical protein
MKKCQYCETEFTPTKGASGIFCSQKCYYSNKKRQGQLRIQKDLEEGKKTCSMCDERKVFDDFIKDNKTPDGFSYNCKSCSTVVRSKSKDKKEKTFIPTILEKECKKCCTVKSVEEFRIHITTKDGYTSICKSCNNKESKEFLEKRKREKLYVIPSEIKKCGHCKERKSKTEFFSSCRTKDGLRGTCNECEKKKRNQYKDKSNERNLQRYKNDPIVRLKHLLRSRLAKYVKRKSVPMNNIIGCDWNELKNYIENKFVDGMTWENWGQYGWHVDHIIPLDSATTENDLYKLSHYTNLQPLWAKDNRLKSNKILEGTNN